MFEGDFEDLLFPEITLETEDILMNLIIKKDYSSIKDINQRKEELISDLKLFIKEFEESSESLEFVKYYDD